MRAQVANRETFQESRAAGNRIRHFLNAVGLELTRKLVLHDFVNAPQTLQPPGRHRVGTHRGARVRQNREQLQAFDSSNAIGELADCGWIVDIAAAHHIGQIQLMLDQEVYIALFLGRQADAFHGLPGELHRCRHYLARRRSASRAVEQQDESH